MPNPEQAEKKGKAVAQEKAKALPNSKSARGGKSNKRENSVAKGQVVGVPSNSERTNRKRKDLPSKVDGRGRRDTDHGYSRRPTKKARGNMQGRQSNAFRNPRSNPHSGEGPVYAADSVAYRNPYASGYAASSSSYPVHAYGAIPGPKRCHSDMEPHAGYLEPAVGKRGRPLAAGYLESAVGNQGRAHPGYVEPPLATRGQPHAGYIEPAFGNQGHDPYDYGHRRVGGYDSQGSRGSAYGAGRCCPDDTLASCKWKHPTSSLTALPPLSIL
ncbi:hypothetical protein L1049_021355 [Liquidambar formosana]|uniref:Uncharacterized protein n=1 Tax=Liquidambar formosana TaxID=63359 RepID=A0AAP0XAT8_LIQFO